LEPKNGKNSQTGYDFLEAQLPPQLDELDNGKELSCPNIVVAMNWILAD
jgi:hypothetical protein